MKRKKILLMAVLVIILILLIHIIKNFIIIKKLQQNVTPYLSSMNYHVKSVSKESEGITVTTNYYQKDHKQACFVEKDNNGHIIYIFMYSTGEKTNIFIESSNIKTAELNVDTSINSLLYNYLQTNNGWQMLLTSVTSNIKISEYNNRECYIIDNFFSTNTLNGIHQNEVYFEKISGLPVKEIVDKTVSEKEYEFNNVDDAIFIEPDISEYTVQNN